jgi:hypothetical protein
MVMVISPNKRYMEQLAREAAKSASPDGPPAGEMQAASENEAASDAAEKG